MNGTSVPALAACCMLSLGMLGQTVQGAVDITVERHGALVELPDPPGPVDLYGLIFNSGSEQLTLTGELSTDQPAAWLPAGICIGDACFPSDTPFDVQLEAGALDTFHVSLFPYEEPGKGLFRFSLVNGAEGDSADIELLAGVSAILVDDDGGDDFEAFLEPIISSEELGYLVWNQALEPLRADDLDLLEHIIWLTGNVSAPLSAEETDVIGAFLTDGGKVILTGENILEGDAAEALGRDVLGAEVQSTTVESRRVHGVLDGPIPELVAFDIAGGAGADNQVAPDGLSAVGAGRITLEYDSGDVAAVRRIILGAGRSVVCGFGLEAVSEPEVLEAVLSNLLEWLDSLGSSELPAMITELSIRNVKPNPSNGTLRIGLSVPNGTPVTIMLADLGGRLVGHLYEGRWNQQVVRLPKAPDGAYSLIVKANGSMAQTPIVVFGD